MTAYFPCNSTLEGGLLDCKGHKLRTLHDYLAGSAPYVSVAMDIGLRLTYGTSLRIPALSAYYKTDIQFRIVDNGAAFSGKGLSRIDICVADEHASLQSLVNTTQWAVAEVDTATWARLQKSW